MNFVKLERTGKSPLAFEGQLLSETRTSRHPLHPRFSGKVNIVERIRFFVTKNGIIVLESVKLDLENLENTDRFAQSYKTIEEAVDSLMILSFVSNRLYNFVVDDVSRLMGPGKS